jgi:hypothetical protein
MPTPAGNRSCDAWGLFVRRGPARHKGARDLCRGRGGKGDVEGVVLLLDCLTLGPRAFS